MKRIAILPVAVVMVFAMTFGLCACESDHVHVYGQEVIKEATCYSEGEVKLTCIHCGDTRNIVMPIVPHSFTVWEVKENVTCTEEGLWKRNCTMCGLEQTGIIPARGHKFSEWEIEEATCETKGVMRRTCQVCGEKEAQVIGELGHVFSREYTIDKYPTASEDGMRSRHCLRSGCNGRTDIEIIPKLSGN